MGYNATALAMRRNWSILDFLVLGDSLSHYKQLKRAVKWDLLLNEREKISSGSCAFDKRSMSSQGNDVRCLFKRAAWVFDVDEIIANMIIIVLTFSIRYDWRIGKKWRNQAVGVFDSLNIARSHQMASHRSIRINGQLKRHINRATLGNSWQCPHLLRLFIVSNTDNFTTSSSLHSLGIFLFATRSHPRLPNLANNETLEKVQQTMYVVLCCIAHVLCCVANLLRSCNKDMEISRRFRVRHWIRYMST